LHEKDVLTVAKMTPDRAADYFRLDNYYQQQDSADTSEWWGGGAEEMGLTGHVDPAVFSNLCHGYDSTRELLLRLEAHNGKAIAGIDTTFSAPKSFSLACLVAGDDRLLEAQKQAVKNTIKIMGDRLLNTQVKGQKVVAHKPIVALFAHDTSRDLDPQVHTHAFWLNLVQTADGKWQSMSNELFYRHQMLYGQVYRNELARLTQELGYKIENRADGLFEIEGYSRDELLTFSQRHNEILQTLEDLGLPDTTENRIYALFKTRKPKNNGIDRGAMREYWIRTAERAGIKHPAPGDAIYDPADLDELVSQALRHCEERRSVFAIEEAEKFITEIPTGHKIADITKAVETHPLVLKKDGLLGTAHSLEREKQTLALMEWGKGRMTALGDRIEATDLTKAQRDVVNLTLESTDQVLGWVGVAGAGKTHTVKALIDAIGDKAIVTGLAPDGSAAETLWQETQIKTNTVASFLFEEPCVNTQRRVVLVDEAGKLSAREAYALLEKSRLENFQVALIGDYEQLSAVEAGSPFKALVENGMTISRLGDFLRQKDPVLNLAVQMLYHDWGQDSLSLLNNRGWIKEYQDFDQRINAIAQQWVESGLHTTRVIAGTHKEKDALTVVLRAKLKELGMLGDANYTSKILKSKDMTEEQSQHARYYTVGDVVVPSRDRNGLKQSRQYHVTAISGDTLTLVSSTGVREVSMKDLKRSMAVRIYQPKTIDFSVGDRLHWTQNNRTLGRFNGREFTVVGIDGDIVALRYDNGRRDQISLKQLNHVEHGLVRTIYSSQGMTCEKAIIAIGEDLGVNRESLLVAITRARIEALIFCQSKKTLFERIEQSNIQPNIQEWLTEKGFKLKAPAPPLHIDLKHWVERIEGSGVLPEVAELNVETIKDDEVYRELLETRINKISKPSNGRLQTKPILRLKVHYKQVAEGGGAWNKSGVAATALPGLKVGDRAPLKTWGELKPDNPRVDVDKTLKTGKRQVRKYEAPLDEPKGIFLPNVPPEIADKIFERYGVNPTPEQRKSGFWPCVYWYPQIEIQITEGAKKAEAIASQAYAAIGLPSITGGYRSKDSNGEPLTKRMLHEELAIFAQRDRPILIALDEDTKAKTISDVRRDTVRMGELFEASASRVRVAHWSNKTKGSDDFIVNEGPKAWEQRIAKAAPLSWEAQKYYKEQYGKLQGYVQKIHGKAPDPRKLDIAVAFVADPRDAAKILCFSPQIKNTPAQEAEAYVKEVYREAIAIKKRLGEKVKIESLEEVRVPAIRL
jgi:conjugative relaxase-like TrwC/TraI family protein